MAHVPRISAPRYLAGQNRYAAAVLWKLSKMTGLQSRMQIDVGGQRVTMRTGTPDFSVANSCLRGEFDDLIAAAGDIGDGLIIDAGGYIGTAAIAFARAFPSATIVTLEPSRDNFAILTRNVASFPNIIALNKAIGPQRGELVLHNRGTGEWGFTMVADPLDRPAKAMHKVEVTTVQDVMDMVKRDTIAIFKIDIEGGEKALLSDNIGWVAKTGILCAELHDRIVAGCTETFEIATAGRSNRQLDGEKIMSIA